MYNLELAKDAQSRYQLFQNELTIILHTSRNVVDQQTYEVFSKAYAVAGNAAYEMGNAIKRIEELEQQLASK